MKLTDEEKYEKEQELEEEKQETLETWSNICKKNEELRNYTGTDTDHYKYRGRGYAKSNCLLFVFVIGGVAAMFILAAMGFNRLAPKVLFTSLFAAALCGAAAYFFPLITLRRHIAYLDKRCTVEVRGRCVKVGRITYAEAQAAFIEGRLYRDPIEVESAKNGELYYDPEYVIQYNGETYHLCERRFSEYPVAVDSERTLYIDPEAPTVFFDLNRYASEYSREKKNCFAGANGPLMAILIFGTLFYFFVLRSVIK